MCQCTAFMNCTGNTSLSPPPHVPTRERPLLSSQSSSSLLFQFLPYRYPFPLPYSVTLALLLEHSLSFPSALLMYKWICNGELDVFFTPSPPTPSISVPSLHVYSPSLSPSHLRPSLPPTVWPTEVSNHDQEYC